MRQFFPKNAKSKYFVSYYDYYQPEAYVPQAGYIEKDSSLNEEVEQLRYSATRSRTGQAGCHRGGGH